MSVESKPLDWKVNTPALLKEILNSNEGMAILAAPLQIFANILAEVAQRASELGDNRLNLLMARLALYECSDPNSKEYDPEFIKALEAGCAIDIPREQANSKIKYPRAEDE